MRPIDVLVGYDGRAEALPKVKGGRPPPRVHLRLSGGFRVEDVKVRLQCSTLGELQKTQRARKSFNTVFFSLFKSSSKGTGLSEGPLVTFEPLPLIDPGLKPESIDTHLLTNFSFESVGLSAYAWAEGQSRQL